MPRKKMKTDDEILRETLEFFGPKFENLTKGFWLGIRRDDGVCVIRSSGEPPACGCSLGVLGYVIKPYDEFGARNNVASRPDVLRRVATAFLTVIDEGDFTPNPLAEYFVTGAATRLVRRSITDEVNTSFVIDFVVDINDQYPDVARRGWTLIRDELNSQELTTA